MSKIRVGVLRGGPGSEYEVSLKTGAHVIERLPKERYHPIDIFIDKNGGWYVQGLERNPWEISGLVDVVFNALHGTYGEDGKVQQLFEMHKIPYTGSGIQPSAVGMNKILSKETAARFGIKVPYHQVMTRAEYESSSPYELFRRILVPVVVKPLCGGSSVGTSLAQSRDELWERIGEAFKYDETIILERYIRGTEATVGVVDEFRGKKRYALIPIEIEHPDKNDIWKYDDKYSGVTREHCPGRFPLKTKRELERLAILAHEAIGARHYSRSDFIISPRGIYFLEINTLPGLTKESLVPKALESAGATMSDFLDHIIKLALARR